MPVYDYKCEKCEDVHEEMREIDKRDDKSTCPKCKSKAKRIPVRTGVVYNTVMAY